jgi:hypothetical protein
MRMSLNSYVYSIIDKLDLHKSLGLLALRIAQVEAAFAELIDEGLAGYG